MPRRYLAAILVLVMTGSFFLGLQLHATSTPLYKIPEVRIQVVDVDGEPVPEVNVWMWVRDRMSGVKWVVLDGSGHLSSPKRVNVSAGNHTHIPGVTDSNGVAVLAARDYAPFADDSFPEVFKGSLRVENIEIGIYFGRGRSDGISRSDGYLPHEMTTGDGRAFGSFAEFSLLDPSNSVPELVRFRILSPKGLIPTRNGVEPCGPSLFYAAGVDPPKSLE